MSVNQETLSARGSALDQKEDAPDLEYSLVRSDSLAMFGAAIGGAILGMLLTLLVLAIVNGGTLRFSNGDRISTLESNMTRINDNVGAVSYNVDTVAEQLSTVAGTLAAVQSDVDLRGEDIVGLNDAIATLDVTRQQFDTFVGALSEAMTAMEAVTLDGEAAMGEDEAAPAAESASSGVASVSQIMVESSADVAAGNVAVLLFNDANGNGAMDDSEGLTTGATAVLSDAEGNEVDSAEATDAGILFEELDAGTYIVSVDGVGEAEVTVDEGAEEGSIVYMPLAE